MPLCPNDKAFLKDIGDGILQCPLCEFNIPGNTKPRIDELYAWVSVDEEGREGLIACRSTPSSALMLLVNSELVTARKLKPMAVHALSTIPGYHARLVRFMRGKTIDDAAP